MNKFRFGDIIVYNKVSYIYLGQYFNYKEEGYFFDILLDLTYPLKKYWLLSLNEFVKERKLIIDSLNINLSFVYIYEDELIESTYLHINIAKELRSYLLKLKMINKNVPDYCSRQELERLKQLYINKLRTKYKVYIEAKLGDLFNYNGKEYIYQGIYCDKSAFINFNTFSSIPMQFVSVSLYSRNYGYSSIMIETLCNCAKVGTTDYKLPFDNNTCNRDYSMMKKECKGLDYI